jgi:hypothetical protein
MTVPIQIWQPFFHTTPFDDAFSRDLQRAMAAWRGEDFVYLLPGAEEEAAWFLLQDGLRIGQRLLRSEELDVISLYHVDEGRHLYPPLPLPETWQKTLPAGLYKKWLGVLPNLVKGATSLKMPLPVLNNGKTTFRNATITLGPGPMIPVTEVGKQDATFAMRWPPPDSRAPSPVSVEMESQRFYGALKRELRAFDGEQVEVIVPEKDPEMRGFNVWFQWPEPFDRLFPLGGGYDLILHHAKLRHCIEKLGEGRHGEVLREAEGWVSRLTGEGEALLDRAWFVPKFFAMEEEEVLFEVEGRFNIAADSYQELQQTDRFMESLRTWTKVRRAQGWLGYFWWEFYQDLKAHITVRFCKHCGNIISGGHADRQYCHRTENPACYRERNALQQKRGRQNRS